MSTAVMESPVKNGKAARGKPLDTATEGGGDLPPVTPEPTPEVQAALAEFAASVRDGEASRSRSELQSGRKLRVFATAYRAQFSKATLADTLAVALVEVVSIIGSDRATLYRWLRQADLAAEAPQAEHLPGRALMAICRAPFQLLGHDGVYHVATAHKEAVLGIIDRAVRDGLSGVKVSEALAALPGADGGKDKPERKKQPKRYALASVADKPELASELAQQAWGIESAKAFAIALAKRVDAESIAAAIADSILNVLSARRDSVAKVN